VGPGGWSISIAEGPPSSSLGLQGRILHQIRLPVFHMGTRGFLFLKEAKQRSCISARHKRHTGDAFSNQPMVAGVSPQRNVGTLK